MKMSKNVHSLMDGLCYEGDTCTYFLAEKTWMSRQKDEVLRRLWADQEKARDNRWTNDRPYVVALREELKHRGLVR